MLRINWQESGGAAGGYWQVTALTSGRHDSGEAPGGSKGGEKPGFWVYFEGEPVRFADSWDDRQEERN